MPPPKTQLPKSAEEWTALLDPFPCSNCTELSKNLKECFYCGEDDLCPDCMNASVHSCENWEYGTLDSEEQSLRDADHYYDRDR